MSDTNDGSNKKEKKRKKKKPGLFAQLIFFLAFGVLISFLLAFWRFLKGQGFAMRKFPIIVSFVIWFLCIGEFSDSDKGNNETKSSEKKPQAAPSESFKLDPPKVVLRESVVAEEGSCKEQQEYLKSLQSEIDDVFLGCAGIIKQIIDGTVSELCYEGLFRCYSQSLYATGFELLIQEYWDWHVLCHTRELLFLGGYPVSTAPWFYYQQLFGTEKSGRGLILYAPEYPGQNWLNRVVPVYQCLNVLLSGNENMHERIEKGLNRFCILQESLKAPACCVGYTDDGKCTLPELATLFPAGETAVSYSNKVGQWRDALFASGKSSDLVEDVAFENWVTCTAALMWYYALSEPLNADKLREAIEDYHRMTVQYVKWDGKNAVQTKLAKVLEFPSAEDEEAYYLDHFQKSVTTNTLFCNVNKVGFLFDELSKNLIPLEKVEELLVNLYVLKMTDSRERMNQEWGHIDVWMDIKLKLGVPEECFVLAAALSQMDIQDLELKVLKKLKNSGISVPNQFLERLMMLENAGTAVIYENPDMDGFSFDSSSVEWGEKEMAAFFTKCLMMNKIPAYSLAIRKWTKTVPLAVNRKVDVEKIYGDLTQLADDYDGEIQYERTTAKAVNLINETYSDAVLFRFMSERNRCVSMLFYCERFGRNFCIVIFTLFTPDRELPPNVLEKYCIAIKWNTYVDSFQESILQVVDEGLKEKESIYDSPKTQTSEKKWFGDA